MLNQTWCRQQEELRQLATQASAASQQLQAALSQLQQDLRQCQVPPAGLVSQVQDLERRLQDLQALQASQKDGDEQLAR